MFILLLPVLCLGAMYENPVSKDNTPDPGVYLHENHTYIVVTTGSDSSGAFSVHESTDLVSYTSKGHLFLTKEVPDWSVAPNEKNAAWWAPEVHKWPLGFISVYTARNKANGMLSVGLATSTSSPLGPWKHTVRPVVTNASMGYIDGTFFYDEASKKAYLVWKSDGNAIGVHTPIHLAELEISSSPSIVGEWTTLITNDLAWEGVLVEAPWLFKHEGTYYLFYSGSEMANYAVGVARSEHITGPYEKHGDPILHTNTTSSPPVGPGHCSVQKLTDGSIGIWYHTWEHAAPVNFSLPRVLFFDPITFSSDNWPVVKNEIPSTTPQHVP